MSNFFDKENFVLEYQNVRQKAIEAEKNDDRSGIMSNTVYGKQ